MNKKHFILGGDIKKSLEVGCKLDFKVLLKDAFVLTKKHFFPLLTASVFSLFIVLGVYGLIYTVLTVLSPEMQTIAEFVLATFVITPLMTGLLMMGVNHSVGLKSRSIDVFNCFKVFRPLALASMFTNLIVLAISTALTAALGDDIGLKLSIIVMLYSSVVFCLIYPLIAEKKVSPLLTLVLSFKVVNKNLMQFTLLFIIIGLLAAVATLPSGLGLFFFIPFYFNLMGVVYRHVCGVGKDILFCNFG